MSLPYYIDMIGVLVFAISGALAAAGKKMYQDIFGVFFTGFISAIGGGTLRDVTLGVYPLAWVKHIDYLVFITLGVLLTVIFKKAILKLHKVIFFLDTIGIGVYTILGVQKSLQYGVNPFAAIILGMISAVFGGVIRDTLINELPLIFQKEIYATACMAGAVVYVLLDYYGIHTDWNAIGCILLIIIVRLIAVKYQLSLPKIDF
ncbi:trimeric intracellular cation channel family protein [Runella sp. MFBS21]|uniref:trimeric intracellular cation channel family protein n=1 Tax=Runella sp. MFBS21 TaxID=3034018 RepID=UPI0023F94DCF|nr:trimeric intracellular cation channel family protein [Runella sp. MFBS21]MDF7818733.1 trimeric intracellular cation channel family protein [Runella sp. MFBS21]